MITHVVLMKFQPDPQGAVIDEAMTRLRGMLGRVASLRALEAGRHVGPASERAFDLALVTRFDDLAGLAEYAVDPAHVEVKSWLALHLQQSLVVDFSGG